MKKIIISLIYAFMVILPFNTTVARAAETEYLRVITDDTPFYASVSDSNPLFYLPYTYYVKLLNTENGFCHVECFVSNDTPSIDGFVPEGVLFEDGLSVTAPYVSVDVKTATTTILYSDGSLVTPVQYVFPERHMRYYGVLPTDNGNVYYVEYNDKLGYVKESDVYPFLIANHPNELTFIVPEQPEIEQPDKEALDVNNADFSDLKLIIVGCMLFAGVIALIIVLKQRVKKPISVGYYDENDYE